MTREPADTSMQYTEFQEVIILNGTERTDVSLHHKFEMFQVPIFQTIWNRRIIESNQPTSTVVTVFQLPA